MKNKRLIYQNIVFMSKSSKTESILKDKVKSTTFLQNENNSTEQPCLPCKAAENTLWRVYVYHNQFFQDPEQAGMSYKLVGDALQQFAGFSAAHVQSIFTSMALLPSEMHMIYSGNQQVATQIQSALHQAGLKTSIEAALKTF